MGKSFEISEDFIAEKLLFQRKMKVGAFSIGAFNFKHRAHHDKQVLSDTHSKAGSFDIAISLFFDSFKLGKELLHVVGLYSNPGIFYRN